MMVTRRIIFSIMMAGFCLAACHRDEEVVPGADAAFVPEELVRIQVAKDYDVSFYEVAPGTIIINQLRSIEAEQSASPEVNDIVNNGSYVEIYKKLAGRAFDKTVLKKIEAAQVRADNRLAKGIVTRMGEPLVPQSIDNDANNGARTAVKKCSGSISEYGGGLFKQMYVDHPEPAGGIVLGWNRDQSYANVPISTGSALKFKVTVMNGQLLESGNDVWELLAGHSNLIIVHPRFAMSEIVPQNVSGSLSFAFPIGSGLNCKSTHFAIVAYNAVNFPDL